jgi:hypothetical protein
MEVGARRLTVVALSVWMLGTVVVRAQVALTREFERSVEAAPGGRLLLDLEAGGDVHLQGWDEDRVVVRAHLGGRNWQDTIVVLEPVRGGVRLHVRLLPLQSASTAHKFDVRLPRRYDIEADSVSGALVIRDVDGTVTGQTASGRIDLERMRGRVELATGSGRVAIRDSDLDGLVTTGHGPADVVDVRGSVRVVGAGKPAAGRAVRRVDRAAFDSTQPIHIRRPAGDIDLAEARRGATVHTDGGAIRIGPSSGPVEATTGGGRIDLGPAAGSVVARTGNGDVRVSVSASDDPARVIDILSGLGNVVIDLPANFAGEVDLETAYTDGFGRATQIGSPWMLSQQSTAEWDSTRGTPRRYVRARGRIGNGGTTLRVRTVNGDITLRPVP